MDRCNTILMLEPWGEGGMVVLDDDMLDQFFGKLQKQRESDDD